MIAEYDRNRHSNVDRREAYERLVGKPDTIFILSGGIIKTPEGEQSTPYESTDHIGLFGGGEARVLAAATLAGQFPESRIITNSVVKDDGDHAQVYADELVRYGVDTTRITTQKDSNSTATEMAALVKIAVSNPGEDIIVITNGYHIPRASLMLQELDKIIPSEVDPELPQYIIRYRQGAGTIRFVSAEEILSNTSQEYQELINKAISDENPAYKERQKAEERGIKAIEEGKYVLRAS